MTQQCRPTEVSRRTRKKINKINKILSSVLLLFLFFCITTMACQPTATTVLSKQQDEEGSKDDEKLGEEQQQQRKDPSSKFTVFGYLPEWRYEGANFKTLAQHLTHLILFSLEPSSDGRIVALDRLPAPDVLQEIHNAAGDCQILICFGGNGRSNGFSEMVQSSNARSKFVELLVVLCDKYKFNGVDYNWEYPGFTFGRGYQIFEKIQQDYEGLANLIIETRVAFNQYNNANDKDDHELSTITMAYYPDTRQEKLLVEHGIANVVDYMHSMSYDQGSRGGMHHSSFNFGKKTVSQAETSQLPLHKVTLGLPFYGRYMDASGEWVTYEDIVQQHHPLDQNLDQVKVQRHTSKDMNLGFNGLTTIYDKTKYAQQHELGGVMIWEAGQDCRVEKVTRHGQTHVVTCPNGSESSLLVAITKALTTKKETTTTTTTTTEEENSRGGDEL